MLTIKIYLKESGQVADMKKDFPVYQGQFNNILLNVFVPTSLLAPYFQEIANGAVVSPYVAGTAVKIAMRTIERNGSYKMSNDHYMRYIKTLAKDGVSYALFERKMPQEFTNYAGQGVNAPTLIINAVNVQYGEISSATAASSNNALTVTTDLAKVKANLPAVSAVYEFIYNAAMGSWTIDGKACSLDDYGVTVTGTPADQNVITLTIAASEPVVQTTLTSQTVNIDVQPSSSLDNDVPKAADEWANTQAKINSLTAQINALINAVAQRQTIDDEDLNTTEKQIVPAINEVNTRTNTNASAISNINQTLTNIGNTFSMGENPIGTMRGSSLPTQEELNAFVVANTDPSRNPKAGDTIIFVLLIPNATDKNYKYIYSGETKSWGKFEIPPLEAAGNGSLGIIEGTYNIPGKDYSVLVDIVSGEIRNIFIKAGTSDNYVNLKEFYDSTALTFNEIEDGDKKVGLAQKAIEDNAGNVIADTYQTKTDGATKQYVVNYALPKEFNNVFYLTESGYSEELPTDPTTIAVNVASIGYSTLFEKSISLDTDTDIQLGSKNAFSNVFYASATTPENVVFHLTTSATQGDVTTVVAITDVPIDVSSAGVRVEFRDVMSELGVKVISLGKGDKITQKLEIFREVSTASTFTVYSSSTQPSVFYLYTGAVSVTGATVVQSTGDSQADVMSQIAVTQELKKRGLKGKAIDFPYGDPTVTYDTTDGMHIVGTMRVYTNADKSEFYDVPNVDVELPLVPSDNSIVIDADPTGKKINISADIPYSSSTPFMDGVGSVGSANTVARGDHRHPSDTSRQEKLVSGENIKTINGQSVLGSGDIPISGGGSEYENTSETVELTNTYTSLNTLCSDVLTNKTKVSYVAYSKISGIKVFTIPLGLYSSENGYVYFKFVGNGRTVTDSTSITDQYIEVFYLDRRAQYDKRTYIGHLYLGDAQSLATDWGFTGWRIPTYGTSTATNINYKGFSEAVYIWQDSQNDAYWKIDSTGIVRNYQGQIRDHVLIWGPNSNTKTINGETIYGSGDITVGGSKYYKHYLEIDFTYNTSPETATIYMTDINYAASTISDASGFVNACFPVQESPTYPATYHEATGFYGNTPIVAIKYTASKIYAVTTTGEKDITPSVGMWVVIDYVIDLSTNMKPVTT